MEINDMTHKLYIAITLLAAAGISAAGAGTASDSINIGYSLASMTPRVVPMSADGTFPATTALDDSNSTVMTLTDNGYVANGIDITNGGFVFYAPYPSPGKPEEQWEMMYLTLAVWAEHPAMLRYLNPLFRVFSTQNPADVCIEVPEGTYDIHFFTRRQQESAAADQFYELFSIVNSNDPEPSVHPTELYLVDQYNMALKLPEEEPGVYAAEVVLPADGFKICYQSMGYYVPAFVFGPRDIADSSLRNGSECALVYGGNAYVPFTYATGVAEESQRLGTGVKANVTVTIGPEDELLRIERADYVTGVESISIDNMQQPQYYTLSGLPVASPREGSVYIRHFPDGHCDKVFIF